MVEVVKQYPKLLAFLELFYPELYLMISSHSENSDLVESNLICSNNKHSYQAIIYSEDVAKDGELLEVYAGKKYIIPYSWDWRWVFAVKIVYKGNIVFPIKFKQKVIALPTGNNPLTEVFFNIIQDEYRTVIKEILNLSIEEQIPMCESYLRYYQSMSFINEA